MVGMTTLVQWCSFERHLRKTLSPRDQMPLNLFYIFFLAHATRKPNSSVSESIQPITIWYINMMYLGIYTYIHICISIQICTQCVFANWAVHSVRCTPLITCSFSHHIDCIWGRLHLYIISFFSNLGWRLPVIEEEREGGRERCTEEGKQKNKNSGRERKKMKRKKERKKDADLRVQVLILTSLWTLPHFLTHKRRLVMPFWHTYHKRR